MNNKVLKGLGATLKKHSPQILTGVGITGMVTAAVVAVGATPKALYLIDKKKDQLKTRKLTVVETVKATWYCYIPSLVTGAVSVACLIGASAVSYQRNAALATAYALSETAMKEYKNKVIEVIGEKKERAVRDAVAKDTIENNPVTNREIIITEQGETLCYDALSGRYFKSDIDKLKKAENALNKQMLSDMYISLNEFYYAIGLDGIGVGDILGWGLDSSGYIDLDFSSQLTEDGTPCLVLGHNVPPKYDY